jgi:hypothetical protein
VKRREKYSPEWRVLGPDIIERISKRTGIKESELETK